MMLEHTKDKYIFCITRLTLDGMLLRFLFAATVYKRAPFYPSKAFEGDIVT